MTTQTHLKSFFAAVLLIAFLSIGLNAAVKIKSETVTIESPVINQSSEKRIETVLTSMYGVEGACIKAIDRTIRVKYDPSKISPEQIRDIISNAGCE